MLKLDDAQPVISAGSSHADYRHAAWTTDARRSAGGSATGRRYAHESVAELIVRARLRNPLCIHNAEPALLSMTSRPPPATASTAECGGGLHTLCLLAATPSSQSIGACSCIFVANSSSVNLSQSTTSSFSGIFAIDAYFGRLQA